MPRLIQPDLPRDVELAVAFMGNRAQAEILRVLARKGPCSIGLLLEGVSVTRPSLNRHVVALETIGVIVGHPAVGQRHGKPVVYALNPTRFEELVDGYIRYVTGE